MRGILMKKRNRLRILVGVFGLGAPGAWVGAVVENNVRGALVWLRFRGGRWKTMKV